MSTTLAPDGTSSLNSDRTTGVWLYHENGTVTVLDSWASANQPKWQPTTFDIQLPASPHTPYDDDVGLSPASRRD